MDEKVIDDAGSLGVEPQYDDSLEPSESLSLGFPELELELDAGDDDLSSDPGAELRNLLEEIPAPLSATDLNPALDVLNDLEAWPDDIDVSAAQCLLCWRLVERLRQGQALPDLQTLA